MKDDEPGQEGQTPAQAAAYIAELSGSLSAIARRHRLDTLGYILDMARLEAENSTRRSDGAAADLK